MIIKKCLHYINKYVILSKSALLDGVDEDLM